MRIMFVPMIPFLILHPALYSQIIFQQPLSERVVTYTIDVRLDPENKTLKGKQTLVWRNPSDDLITELQFHLYLNAFKNRESTFMKESGGRLREIPMEEDGWGWIDITRMAVQDGEDLTPKIEFIHPDDDNENDHTVVRVPLSRPVMPRQSIAVGIDFTARLPRVFARTGYHKNFFMVAQWFPKIGVYEAPGMRYATKGRWNCHQFHANTEFYANYGVYEVAITLPQHFIVGATGLLQSEVKLSDGNKTVRYRAEDVHDFAWTAFPDFTVVEDQWNHVTIRLLLSPDHTHHAQRYLHAAKAALAYFSNWVGEYPYPNLTIVDPPYGAWGAGGMEYPTLITGGSLWALPHGLRLIEGVTVHEFGHQYWYGMVGNNEFEEAWLDEGLNQYSETRIMDETYGVKSSVVDIAGYRMGDLESARSGYRGMKNPKIAPTFQNAWEFPPGSYGPLTYAKTATFLTTLERLIGRPVMDEIMRTYFQRWKFKHPSSRDFIAVVNDVVRKHHGERFGKDMNWFFDQVLYSTNICDYELTSLSARQGDSSNEKGRGSTAPLQQTEYESRVLVSRLGEVVMPVDVLIGFDDGSEKRLRWDGQNRWKEFRIRDSRRVVWAKVDPNQILTIDVNYLNNSKSLKPSRTAIWKYTIRWLFWVQNVFQYAAFF
jgi:hypothetical protein